MYSVLVTLYGFLSAILILSVQGHAVAKLETRGSSNFSDPDHDKLGAIASESAVCSKIGVELLKKGGNAADAVRCYYGSDSCSTMLIIRRLACWHAVLRWGHW